MAGCNPIVLTTDEPILNNLHEWKPLPGIICVRRPAELARDETPMRLVVEHVLAQVPGPPDQIVVLLQPTQPLRQPRHVLAAIELIRQGAQSVMSITPTESPDKCVAIRNGVVRPWQGNPIERRQDARPAYRRDGTVNAFTREYGYCYFPADPLVIPPSETCPLDTPDDWLEAERRLRGLSEVPR